MNIEKAKMYKTAKVVMDCGSIKAGDFVAVEFAFGDFNGMVFDIKDIRGNFEKSVPAHPFLSDFCL